jgi:CBS domain-containing protein
MSSPLVTIDEDKTASEAMEVMRSKSVCRMVVVKGRNVIGLVTERRVFGICKCFPQNN